MKRTLLACWYECLLAAVTLVVFFCVAALACYGAEAPAIVGPTEPVEVREPAWLEITGIATGQAAMFWPEAYLQVGPPHLVDLHAMFWSATPGEYSIRGVVVRIEVVNGVPLPFLTPLSSTVTVGGDPDPGPDPGPDPDPDPDPDPTPAESLWGLLLYDPDELDNDLEISKMVVSTRLGNIEDLEFKPFDIGTLDEDDEVPESLAPWIKMVRDNGWPLPQLLLINENGDLSAHVQATTIDAAIKLVEETLE